MNNIKNFIKNVVVGVLAMILIFLIIMGIFGIIKTIFLFPKTIGYLGIVGWCWLLGGAVFEVRDEIKLLKQEDEDEKQGRSVS